LEQSDKIAALEKAGNNRTCCEIRQLIGAQICSHLEEQPVQYQTDDVLGVRRFSHLGAGSTHRTACNDHFGSQVCQNIHTWNVNRLFISEMNFRVCTVFRT